MSQNAILGHPRGLYYLFFTELWERFSYYGMRALLVLYMTKVFLFTDAKAYLIYGAYTAFVYITPIFGGMIADRLLGYRQAVIMGSILIVLGHICLALPVNGTFYLGLAFIIVGTGFFKSNVSTMVGQLYEKWDKRKDSAYTIFYMGINIGAFFATILVGVIAEKVGWHYGFGLAAIGMLIGLITFIRAKNHLASSSNQPNMTRLKQTILGFSIRYWIYILSIAAVFLFSQLVANPLGVQVILIVVGCGVLLYCFYQMKIGTVEERKHIAAILLLSLFFMVFISFFEQAGSSIMLFTDRLTDRSLLGYEIPTPNFASLNPLFIILLGPLFAALWVMLGKRKREPSTPAKSFIAIVLTSLAFVALFVGALQAMHDHLGSMSWIVLHYFLITAAELCISPVGLSAVSKLAPERLGGTLMGVWMLATAFANYIAGLIATFANIDHSKLTTSAPATIYYTVFSDIAIVAAVIAVLILITVPWIKRLMAYR